MSYVSLIEAPIQEKIIDGQEGKQFRSLLLTLPFHCAEIVLKNIQTGKIIVIVITIQIPITCVHLPFSRSLNLSPLQASIFPSHAAINFLNSSVGSGFSMR